MLGETTMLGATSVDATIAVKDISVARKFYEGVLGLQRYPIDDGGVVRYKSGSSNILVYESQYAGTNRATAATWVVGEDLPGLVRSLKQKGVTFEHYDFDGAKLEGDVHIMGETKAAWLKDPDGNILALVSR